MKSRKMGLVGAFIVLIITVLVGCGGSGGGTGTTGTGWETLSSEAKAYRAVTQMSYDVLCQVGGGCPAIASKGLSYKDIDDVSCTIDGSEYSCEMVGESGVCTVFVAVNEAEDGWILDFECDNYIYTDGTDTYVIDGGYHVESLYSGSEESLTITTTFSTPDGFSIAVNGEIYAYGSDFQMVTIYAVVDSVVTVSFEVSGTVNGESINYSFSINCTQTPEGEGTCTQTS